MEKDETWQSAFATLGESTDISSKLITDLESFVCCMYSKPKLTSVNTEGYMLFQQQYAPRCQSQPLDERN